ncbi:MAG TPA: DUF983 domain-containing protein [Rhodopila sp.]|uniref:DUF983 domain-containing protein n=1 Tax=Rhodopila sp. TaxID=2480087 RepID=UPI002C489255|nr:DUF983 domain-containing protein [Rhodopila sp.]HVY17850.1 DUF983 domain-containing protein [Rhodopila sp.]
MSTNRFWTGVNRGLHRRCPNCGEGALFRGFLAIEPECPHCGANNAAYPSDDLPPYLTIVIVGHIIVPLFMWTDHAFVPPIWVQCAIWLPLTALLTLALLPFVKGAAVGLCWATGTVRPQAGVRG